MVSGSGDLRRGREIEKSKSSGESQQPLSCLPAAYRRQWRNTHGRAAAIGSEVTDHGSLQASGTYGGRLPPSERSNDRSPTNGGPRVRRAGHHHARALPRTAWQSSPGAYRCHFYCSRCLSARSLLSAPSPAVGRLVASYPPRAVSGFRPPAIPAPSRVLGLSNTSVWGSWAGGVAWLHVHAHRDVLAQPHFHDRQKAARWWL